MKENRIVKKVAVSYWEPGPLLIVFPTNQWKTTSPLYYILVCMLQLHTAAIQYVPSDQTLIGVDQ